MSAKSCYKHNLEFKSQLQDEVLNLVCMNITKQDY